MREDTTGFWVFCLFCIVSSLISFFAGMNTIRSGYLVDSRPENCLTYQDGVDDALESMNRCDMRFPGRNYTSSSVNGLYKHPEYFCVWTGDLTGNTTQDLDELSRIAQTTFHELAHMYAENYPSHFKRLED